MATSKVSKKTWKGKSKNKPVWKTKLKPWQIEENEINSLKEKYTDIDASAIETFADIPLCRKTQLGLKEAGYVTPTEIQRQSICLALQDEDILGAAKTGSGKTLAFLIPVLESLNRQHWSKMDGLGALIISPTRELAYQTFEVLCKVGKKHDFSAGLIIGGKNLKEEEQRINQTNIVVCTPGRLLQHMDETSYFTCHNLQILVLDEADRILDQGFQETMNAIIENLPTERQTLLFSATQTQSVQDLARLSLAEPKYVSVHHNHKYSTPSQLEQSYVVCDLDKKLNLIYSFIRNHLKKKILIFLSSCKQVKYVYEVFCRLQPGTPVMALYGTLHQLRRVAIYNDFCRKEHAVLFATDIAARGLDFPAVHWVVQMDCPEDANTYIHRAGRTARYEKGGEALLVLLPSEEREMLAQLVDKKIPIQKIGVNPDKQTSVQKRFESMCAQDFELKQSAQRCFISYLKSVYLMKNKKVFDVHALPIENFAYSLGLAVAPRVRFLQKAEKRQQQLKGGQQGEDPNSSDEGDVTGGRSQAGSADSPGAQCSVKGEAAAAGQRDRAGQRKSSGSATDDREEDGFDGGVAETLPQGEEEEGGFLTVSRKDVFGFTSVAAEGEWGLERDAARPLLASTDSSSAQRQPPPPSSGKIKKASTKFSLAKKLLKKNLKVNTKVVFDNDSGEVIQQWPPSQRTSSANNGDDYQGGIDLVESKKFMEREDQFDKSEFKRKIKEKHREERLKRKGKRKKKKPEDQEREMEVVLSEDETYEPFDVDTLPDPDKFVNQPTVNSDKLELEHNTSDTETEARPLKKRAKIEGKGKKKKKKPKHIGGSMDTFETGMTLLEDEELALHLLKNN